MVRSDWGENWTLLASSAHSAAAAVGDAAAAVGREFGVLKNLAAAAESPINNSGKIAGAFSTITLSLILLSRSRLVSVRSKYLTLTL